MIDYTLDETNSILLIRPKTALAAEDFLCLAEAVDAYITANGPLVGLIIEAPKFPGWEDLAAMVGHFRFVKDHHRQVGKVGLVTDSPLAHIAEQLASHFVSAEIRHFEPGALEDARQWVMSGS